MCAMVVDEQLRAVREEFPAHFIEVYWRPWTDIERILPLYLMHAPRPLGCDTSGLVSPNISPTEEAAVRDLLGQLFTKPELNAVQAYLRGLPWNASHRTENLVFVCKTVNLPIHNAQIALGNPALLPLRHLPIICRDAKRTLGFELREYYPSTQCPSSEEHRLFVRETAREQRVLYWVWVKLARHTVWGDTWLIARYRGNRTLYPYPDLIKYWEPRHGHTPWRVAEALVDSFFTHEEATDVLATLLSAGAVDGAIEPVALPFSVHACNLLEYCFPTSNIAGLPDCTETGVPFFVEYNENLLQMRRGGSANAQCPCEHRMDL